MHPACASRVPSLPHRLPPSPSQPPKEATLTTGQSDHTVPHYAFEMPACHAPARTHAIPTSYLHLLLQGPARAPCGLGLAASLLEQPAALPLQAPG